MYTRLWRCERASLTLASFVSGACSSDIPAPRSRALPLHAASRDEEPTDTEEGGGSGSEAEATEWVCPTYIKWAWVPGTVAAVKDSTGQGHPIQFGSGANFLIMGARPLMGYLDFSYETFKPKGKYALPPVGAPFVSQDKKLIVYSGNVTGWCSYQYYGPPDELWNHRGRLDVVDAELQKTWVPDPPHETTQESACGTQFYQDPDDPCHDADPPALEGTQRTLEGPPFPDVSIVHVRLICDVTDWYDVTCAFGYCSKVFSHTTINNCWEEYD